MNKTASLLFLCICTFISLAALSQDTNVVAARPFVILSADSGWLYLGKRLPKLITEGIIYRSKARFIPLRNSDAGFKDVGSNYCDQPADTGTDKSRQYTAALKAKGAQFFMTGTLSIDPYNSPTVTLNICVTNFADVNESQVFLLSSVYDIPKSVDDMSRFLNDAIRLRGKPKILQTKVLLPGFLMKDGSTDRFTPYLAYSFPDPDRFLVVSNKDIAKSDIYTLGFAGIAGKTTADLIIGGIVDTDRSNYIVKVQIYHKKTSTTPEKTDYLDDVTGSKYDIYSLQDELVATLAAKLTLADTVTNIDSLRKYILREIKEENYSEANAYIKYIKPEDSISRIYFQALLAEQQDFDYQEVIKLLAPVLGDPHITDEIRFLAGKGYYYSNEFALAFNQYDSIQAPVSFPVLSYYKGICLYKQKRYEEARSFFIKQSQTDTLAGYSKILAGSCYLALGDTTTAGQFIQAVYASDTTNAVYQTALAGLNKSIARRYFATGHFGDAKNWYLKALDIDHSRSTLLDVLRTSLNDTLSNQEFESLAGQLISSDTTYLGGHNSNSMATIRDYIDSVGRRDSLGRLNPQSVCWKIYCIQKYLQLSADSDIWYTQALGNDYFDLQDYKTAETYFKQATETNGNSATNLLNLMEVELLLGNTATAAALLQRVYNLRQQFPESVKYHVFSVYSFYRSVTDILNGDARNAKSEIDKIMGAAGYAAKFRKSHVDDHVFQGWTFYNFYDWLQNAKIDEAKRQSIMNNFCAVNKYSTVAVNYSCRLK